MEFKKYTEQEIEAARSAKGGFGRREFAKLGVNWPPRTGWRQALLLGVDPNNPPVGGSERRYRPHINTGPPPEVRENKVESWPDLPLARFYYHKPYVWSR